VTLIIRDAPGMRVAEKPLTIEPRLVCDPSDSLAAQTCVVPHRIPAGCQRWWPAREAAPDGGFAHVAR
jgi:hypothetical protein